MSGPQRQPLLVRTLPAIDWVRSGRRVLIDRAADDLARFQVYRYCSVAEALQLLGRGEWSFARPTLWPDKYERHISQQLFAEHGPFAHSSAHVKCLSLEYSSEAMWRTYSGTAGVVRIGIRMQDLVSMLDRSSLPVSGRIYLARARYMDEARIQREVKALQQTPARGLGAEAMRALCMKRSGFAYENELRICLLGRSKSEPAPILSLSGIDTARVQSLLIDPYLPRWQAEELCQMFAQRLNLKFKIGQSRFDAEIAPD